MARDERFERADLIEQMVSEDTYDLREVGITHPDNSAYFKLCNNGIVEIFAGEGTGIFMNPNTKTITFMADCVKFITNNEDGIRWNDKKLNSQATSFAEPALVPVETEAIPSAYRQVLDYLGDENA